MTASNDEPARSFTGAVRRPGPRLRRFVNRLKIGIIVFAAFVGAALLLLAAEWPFTRNTTIESLERISSCEIRISNFREIFFPEPGYFAQNVTFTRGNPGSPVAKIVQINCRATWLALITFTHRINHIDLEGVKIDIPNHIPPAARKHPEAAIKTTVTELVANGTVLEIASQDSRTQPLRFEFTKLVLRNLARNKAITFQTDIRNSSPPAEMTAAGSVGPLNFGKVGSMPISGVFRLLRANLGTYKVIAGDLSAEGRFHGKLGQAELAGKAAIPNFSVTSSHHSLALTTEYRASVNGTNGDVLLESTQVHFLDTTLVASGSIAGKQAKTVSLNVEDREARVQDLLRLFVTAGNPPLDGSIMLRAHIVLPPSHEPVIKRVRINGNFTITDADFANPTTQQKVDELSARALGHKREIKRNGAPPITENLKSDVKLSDTVAALSSAVFAVPGAVARGGGTYNVSTEAIDLRGELAMRASVSKAAGGFKSILLLPLDPFFKKHGAGAALPVSITGTYSHPVCKVSLRR